MISYTHRLGKNSRKRTFRQRTTTFRRLSIGHYPDRRAGKERHINPFGNRTMTRVSRMMMRASRPTMKMKIFNIDLGPFQNQSRTRRTHSIETIPLLWRTLLVLAASLPKSSSDL
jgi:hypothetical protein